MGESDTAMAFASPCEYEQDWWSGHMSVSMLNPDLTPKPNGIGAVDAPTLGTASNSVTWSLSAKPRRVWRAIQSAEEPAPLNETWIRRIAELEPSFEVIQNDLALFGKPYASLNADERQEALSTSHERYYTFYWRVGPLSALGQGDMLPPAACASERTFEDELDGLRAVRRWILQKSVDRRAEAGRAGHVSSHFRKSQLVLMRAPSGMAWCACRMH